MSRVARQPISVPKGVEVTINGQLVKVKGPLGALEWSCHPAVKVVQEGGQVRVEFDRSDRNAGKFAGTTRALIANMVKGVSEGFERRLQLVGVGYRAQAQGNQLHLSLGFSHPVIHTLAAGVKVETPSQTEIVLKGVDKQRVGQEAARIRAYRPPEPYKGKGIRYADEVVVLKETKKK
ncbi:MAG: 50S ribosomal protein L6 [Hydrogenophilus sp.]|nr:50S ribosomal protein L6 [Hydrogenophilus sp.]